MNKQDIKTLGKNAVKQDVYLYKNHFKHGDPPTTERSLGIWTLNKDPLIMKGNRIEGFDEEIGDGKK